MSSGLTVGLCPNSTEPAWDSLSLPALPPLKINKINFKKKKKDNDSDMPITEHVNQLFIQTIGIVTANF